MDCRINRFHQGAFHIAGTLGVDVLPLVIYGSGKALPKRGRKLNRWPMHLEIDRRISPEEMLSYGETFREQASYLRKYYIRRYSAMANRIEQDV